MKYWAPFLLMLAALALTACGQTDALNANAAQSVANLPVEQTATTTSTPTPPPPTATPTATATSTPAPSPTVTATATVTPSPSPTPGPAIRRLTEGDCCTQPFWSADSTEVRFIDLNPETGQPAIMGIDIARPEAGARVVSARLGVFSPDGRLLAYPEPGRTGLAVLEDLSTGESWTVDIDESAVRFSPDGQQLFWTAFDADQPFENRVSTFWLADLRGENRRQVAALRRGSALAWLNDAAMLVAYLHPAADDTAATPQRYAIARLNLTDGSLTDLFYARRPRGLALNPARTDMVFYSLLSDNPEDNGVWHVRLNDDAPAPRRLPFLGSYQWRDDDTLVYIPFDPQAERHVFYGYNVRTGESQSLTGQTEPALTVANNDWAISPDGRHIVLAAGKNRRPDGLWLVTLSP